MTGVPFSDGREDFRAEEIRAARYEGWHAGLRGDDPRGNPYDKLGEAWHAYNKFHGFAVRLRRGDD